MSFILPNLQWFEAFLGLIAGFGVVIFVHELGHFLAAKWVGIKVTQFAIGLGQAVLSYRSGLGLRVGSTRRALERRVRAHLASTGAAPADGPDPTSISPADTEAAAAALGLGETEYRLNWMPLGGYVKMLGQDDLDPAAAAADPRAFNRKSVGARALVVSAGVVMNILFGVLFFVACFTKGVEFPPALVGGVIRDMPASTAFAEGHEQDPQFQGVRAGDRILQVGNSDVEDFMDFAVRVALARRDQTLRVTVERDGHTLVFPIRPEVDDKGSKLLSVGIERPVSLRLGDPADGPLPPALAEAGVRPGMVLQAVGDQAIERFDQAIQLMAGTGGRPVRLTFADPDSGRQASADMEPSALLQRTDTGTPHLWGLVPPTRVAEVLRGVFRRKPAASAGIKAGDVLASVGAEPWPSYESVSSLIESTNGRPFEITVLRDGELVSLGPLRTDRKGRIGIRLDVDLTRVARCLEGHPTGPLALLSGSRVLRAGGQQVRTYADIQRVLAAAAAAQPDGGSIDIEYELAIKQRPVYTRSIQFGPEDARAISTAWGLPEGLAFRPLLQTFKADSPWAAALMGIRKTHQFVMQTYVTLHRLLFERTVQASHLRGPLGIVDEGTKVARQGWPYLLFFLGLISVNLAVINFLPIPIVDGGLMLFLLIEKAKGSPVSVRVQTAAFYVGLVLIGGIFLLTLYYDTGRLLGGG